MLALTSRAEDDAEIEQPGMEELGAAEGNEGGNSATPEVGCVADVDHRVGLNENRSVLERQLNAFSNNVSCRLFI